VTHPRRCDRQRPGRTLPGLLQAPVEFACPAASRRCATAFSAASSSSSCADPMCSISREPRRDECTICTAVAPDAVLTMRT
jgi:hypothetical protein